MAQNGIDKEGVMPHFKMYQSTSLGNWENYEQFQPWHLIFQLRFEPGSSRIRSQSADHQAMFDTQQQCTSEELGKI